jgi:hypothetical protein
MLAKITVGPSLRAVCRVALFALAACGGGIDVFQDTRPAGDAADTGPSGCVPPQTPRVAPLPMAVPYGVATIRGTAMGARRVIVMSGGNPISSPVLPDGSFCLDVPLAQAGTYSFELYAQADAGCLSAAAAPVSIALDPAAPRPTGATTCNGSDPAMGCAAREVCGNNRDDDCDQLPDAMDPDCRTCMDDGLEPNNDIRTAPRVEVQRTYSGLKICPGDPDFYAVNLRVGQRVTATLNFTHVMGDLDLRIFDTDRMTVVAMSTTTTNTETATWLATHAGVHMVLVAGANPAMPVTNTYSLTLNVFPYP